VFRIIIIVPEFEDTSTTVKRENYPEKQITIYLSVIDILNNFCGNVDLLEVKISNVIK